MTAHRGLVVGLTGGMACGKTSVAKVWQGLGAYVLDADRTVHGLLSGDAAVQHEVREAFGSGAFDADGRIDRAALARVVFQDEARRGRLMEILHPRTREVHLAAATEYFLNNPNGTVVIDAPLLFEAGLDAHVDATVVVGAPYESQITRALDRAVAAGRPMSREEAERRIALQMPLEEKRRRATFIIENDGTRSDLEADATAVWGRIRELAH